MAKKVWTIDLSEDSIDTCIKGLRQYQKELDAKMKTFMQRLADEGIEAIDNVMSFVPQDQEFGDYTVFKSRLIFPSGGHYGEMSVHLQSEKVLFIEFSAGITYGTNTYPLPSGSGYGMGTYNPSSSNWSNPKGWYYKDESSPQANEKGLVHTYGNPAYMPMYRAREAMALKVWQIARDTIGA